MPGSLLPALPDVTVLRDHTLEKEIGNLKQPQIMEISHSSQ